ncbi:WhiB family transcriptional regulator [Streptomyces sp. S1]|uniref:WhiB family transcriptional regulator n=1 Tax=Streptomyces sp. S1 TaxID=718288 RepID=UPI003D729FB6
MRYITDNTTPDTDLRGIADISWHGRGACRTLPADEADRLFFSGPRSHKAIAEAKTICGPCPVKRDCFNYALDNDIRSGMWGGMTEAERRPWHAKVAKRLDYARVRAAIMGRDIHLTAAEREAVARHAYVRSWSPDRLAYALGIDLDYAREFLRRAGHTVADRDRYWGIPADETEAEGAGTNANEDAESGSDETADSASGPKEICQVARQVQTDELLRNLRKAA